jgi:hypothetical protein
VRLWPAFDDSLILVIIEMPCSPIIGLTNQTGRRLGGFAWIAAARYGSHSATSAGSSSTML